jgi:hypothetical protein
MTGAIDLTEKKGNKNWYVFNLSDIQTKIKLDIFYNFFTQNHSGIFILQVNKNNMWFK